MAKRLGRDIRTVTVGTSAVTLAPENPRRWALMVGCPLGASGAWISMQWAVDPTSTQGIPHFFGSRPILFDRNDFG